MKTKNKKTKNIILKCAADFFLPVFLTYGFYVIFHGNSSPGGGFQGGVLIAAVILLLFLGYGHEIVEKVFDEELLHKGESLAEAIYVVIALIGLIFAGLFATNIIFSLGFFEAETTMLMNDAVGLDVLTGVGCLLLMLLKTLSPKSGKEGGK